MELLFDNGQEAPLLGVKEAVGAHFLEASREDVLEEPADETLGGDRRGLGRIGF